MQNTNFKVDPKLTNILGDAYRSTEKALKELIDNSWDAESENVWITLPSPMTDDPIIVRDDGSGMTSKEVEEVYLTIANDRLSRKGDLSPKKNRKIKGRKGIGKFAGLAAADVMKLQTKAKGDSTSVSISKSLLLQTKKDIENIDIPLVVESCKKDEHGTIITLSNLNHNLRFPQPTKLKQLLVLEYSREKDFNIFINDELVTHEDIEGEKFEKEIELENGKKAILKYTITEKPLPKKQSGIVVRVGGKVVGEPNYFGLDTVEDIPSKLTKHITGELETDELEEDVTADWSAILDNSIDFEEFGAEVKGNVAPNLKEKFKNQVNLAKARLQKTINHRLQKLPEYRRKFAYDALDKVLNRFYEDSDDRKTILVDLILDALEKDDYFQVCYEIERAKDSDVSLFAEALNDFGLTDMAILARQAQNRLIFLDDLDYLISKTETDEKMMHKAIEKNLWILGSQYNLMSSNITLSRILNDYLNKKYIGKRKSKRPDLLLNQNINENKLLIEFKTPSKSITREDETQAEKYRDDLSRIFPEGRIEIKVIGKSVTKNINPIYENNTGIDLTSYGSIISKARTELEWLIKELKTDQSV